MLGRPPDAMELNSWIYYQDVPPGVIDVPHLERVLRQLLRNAPDERDATARRALHAAFASEEATAPALNVALERPAPMALAVTALVEEREGGGYAALCRWLARPPVHAAVLAAAGR
jgi:hypothetical protein